MKTSKKIKLMSLDSIIEENMQDPEFARLFAKEQLINAIAKMIYQVRKTTGLTQAELAKKVSTTQPVIARLERGRDRRVPSLELLMRIAAAAGAKLNLTFQI